MTTLAILGAGGRMGQALVRCSASFKDLRVGVALERANHPALGQDVGTLAGVADIGVPLSHDVGRASAADVFIDFSDHRAVPAHAALAAEFGKRMVIGTTGLDLAETRGVEDAARRVGIVWSPNMSLGVNLLVDLVRQASRALGMDYDIEVVEAHHRHKLDAPSGTALFLAKGAAEGRNQDFDQVACYGRQGITGERPRGQIGMHAVRAGSIVGDHTLSLASDTEIIELTHRATSRDAFAMGALRAAAWVASRPAGLYGMKDVLGL
ncbi:MAG: 4-hydroxy-tetrahydrodipicolinate reductase [Verrucomicrobia bacterium]|nr:4-hydroxy-tetrahydrodipicolinate reductase [Verrucomicrobiota bacterium]